MGRQQWWGRCLAGVAVVAVAGCTALDEGTSVAPPDDKASESSSGASRSPAGDGPAGPGDGTLPGVPTAEAARTELAGLKVAAHGSMAGYSRDRFSHWSAQGENCDTRETVLERDGTGVKRDDECRAVSGKWVSVYDDKTLSDASELDIDHMVPLANAWRSGADTWGDDERKAFANDLTHPQLLAVTASSNRSKGDQGPDEWQPPAKTYWCTYGRAWTSVKDTYELTVTEAEKDMLTEMLDTCTS
ncbi:HNH endonuclease family protein [Streptomyces montanus]|nr:HNH endonuclease family protein [Streptomyces montanus]